MRSIAPLSNGKDIAGFILIAFVFDEPALFESSTKRAVTDRWSPIFTAELPIRTIILGEPVSPLQPSIELTEPEHIQQRRSTVFENLIEGLYEVENQLLDQKLSCSFGCRAILLGTLIQNMKRYSLYSPRTGKSLPLRGIKSVIESLREAPSPMYYSSGEESLDGKHSGSWTLTLETRYLKEEMANLGGGVQVRSPEHLFVTIVC